MSLLLVVGARPNFMKMAPVFRALEARELRPILVHTGQHYDRAMSEVFFEQLGMPEPEIHLEVGSDNHARQTARLMERFDAVCAARAPRLVLAGGDVNSTLAAALVAAKRNVTFGHVEAGLRSFDRTMPEEINRIVTDHLSALLFTTEASANAHLANEGIAGEKVHFVGNGMVDTLLAHVDAARATEPWRTWGVEPRRYALLTLHRPSNVDRPEVLGALLRALAEVSAALPILFPVHPRTASRIEASDIELPDTLRRTPPLDYVQFLGLMAEARFVLTDSGGIQEETCALGVECLTLRDNTERPSTLAAGTNRLVGSDPGAVVAAARDAIARRDRLPASAVPLWDGKAGERTAAVVERFLKEGA